jgi:DNA-directed RNA polymerase subunit N (RpoN/RPB10)
MSGNLIPNVCFTCGRELSHYLPEFKQRCASMTVPPDSPKTIRALVLDKLELHNPCCRLPFLFSRIAGVPTN